MNLEKQNLYQRNDSEQGLDLIYGHCAACGEHHFPASPFGCPLCGVAADNVTNVIRPSEAKLLSALTLHAKIDPAIRPPCVIGEAEIAFGLIAEVMLEGEESDFHAGMTITAIGVPVEQNDATVLACRFVPAEGETA